MRITDCQRLNTVVVSVATSRSYLNAVGEVADSARAVAGFPCVLVGASSELLQTSPLSPLVRLVEVPSSRWRPEAVWCTRNMSGWRHTHLLKSELIERVLERGLTNVLAVDADWRFRSDPLHGHGLEGFGVDVCATHARHARAIAEWRA